MSIDSRLLPVVAITGSSILVGCGGYSGSSCGSYGSYGSYGSSGSFGMAAGRTRRVRAARASRATTPTSTDGAPASICGAPVNDSSGIYEGTLTDGATQRTSPVVAIIDENGDGRMSLQDGTYYRLSVSTWGNNVSGSFEAYSPESQPANGSRSTSGSVSATVTPAGLSGTLTNQTGEQEELALNYDTTYTLTSALSVLAGDWSYSGAGFTLTANIQSDGTFSAIDSNNCSYSGAFSLVDSNFDVYGESFIRSCNGSSATFTGLASYFPSASGVPTQIKLLADNHAGGYLIANLE